MRQTMIIHLHESLLNYYENHQRILPWRNNKDPYRIWVSEIMLQQTQVKTVIPYYEKFLNRFPTVQSFSEAQEEEYLKLWEGLGYYSRVKNMHKAAEIIVSQYQGIIPNNSQQLAKLPGIGLYTAGAIASIAFDEITAAVDGNVHRVISRYFGLKLTKEELIPKMNELLPNHHIGDFNQSLMEVGATICLPKADPLCSKCPLNQYCIAFLQGLTNELPVKKEKLNRTQESYTLLIVTDGLKYYLRQRPAKGLLSSLWEFPMFKGEYQEIEPLMTELKINTFTSEKLPGMTHSFTHKDWLITAYLVKTKDNLPINKDYLTVTKDELTSKYTLSSLFKNYQEYYL